MLPRPTSSFEGEIPNEVAYADDGDFIGQNYADIKEVRVALKKIPPYSQHGQDSTHQYEKAKKDGKK